MNTSAQAYELEYTGERIVPGLTPEVNFREHQMRYAFAAQFVPGRVVLDIASGSGIGTDYLRKAGARACLGLDLDCSALKYARSRYRLSHLAACDATLLCLAGRSVEVVVSFETIEHLSDPRAFLWECERVLRPGGLLICSTPNPEITRWHEANPFHVAEMPVHDFARHVNQVFHDCRLYGQDPIPYPLFVAKRTIASTLEKFRLKRWAKRCLRIATDPVCPELEFADCNGDERYAVSSRLPRWPHRPRFVIALARKSARQEMR